MKIPETNSDKRKLKQKAEFHKAVEEKIEKKTYVRDVLSKEENYLLKELQVHQVELEMQNEELVQAQQELEESRARYFNLYDLAPVGYLTLDARGIVLEANLTSAKMLGVTRSRIVNKHLNYFIYRDDQDKFFLHYKEAFRSEKPQTQELRMLRNHNTTFWVSMQAAAEPNIAGIMECRIIISDISDKVKTREALHESEEKYSVIYENSPYAIILLSIPDSIITSVNHSFLKLFHYTRGEVIGKICDDLKIFECSLHEHIGLMLSKDEKTNNFECSFRTKEGTQLYLLLNLNRVTIGGQPCVLVTCNDITEYKKAEEMIDKSKNDYARSNKDLEQFAYAASHDLQEPLRAVTGFVSLLKEEYGDKMDEKNIEYLKYIEEGAARMKALINGLLDYSRINVCGKERKMIDSGECLNQAILNLNLSIQETSAEVTSGPMPMIFAESTQLLQLFQNLVGNAIKFHSEARPVIHISAEHENGFWKFAVRDNGIGIDEKHQERVFRIFQRLHTRDKYPGTGIGLAICRKIVERHNGRIWIEPTPGGGVTFYFTIPDAALHPPFRIRRTGEIDRLRTRREDKKN